MGELGSPALCLAPGEGSVRTGSRNCLMGAGHESRQSAGALVESFMAGLPEWLLKLSMFLRAFAVLAGKSSLEH